jgi:hypothetical protein
MAPAVTGCFDASLAAYAGDARNLPDDRIAAGPVVDDDLLADALAERAAYDASDDVVAAHWWKRNRGAYRAIRIGLRLRAAHAQRETECRERAAQS